MKRTILTVLVLAMTVAAIAAVITRSAEAQTIRVFTAVLLPSNEVPPVTVNPTETASSGNATVTLNTANNTARFDWSMIGLASNSLVILSHIHQGAAAVNGPIVVDSGLTPAAPVAAVSGAFSLTRENLTVPPAIAAGIVANPAGFYFNVHTALSPQGVARGQLVPQQTTGLSAPTLSEWGAILMFLLIGATAIYFIVGRKPALAVPGGSIETAAPASPINWSLMAKVTLYVEAIIALALIGLSSVATAVDVGGALVSGLVVAFIVYLLIANRRN
jgi:hypothetical protein